ncbi:MAG: ferritin family protein [bacterium]
MTLQEALHTAVAYEIKVRDLYLDAIDMVADEDGSNVVKRMAVEEQEHVEYLLNLLNELENTGELPDLKVPNTVPSPEKLAKYVQTLKNHLDSSAMTDAERQSDLAILDSIHQVEQETADFYQRMVDELTVDGKEIFAEFLEVERSHLALVGSEIAYLFGAGQWFDFPEI